MEVWQTRDFLSSNRHGSACRQIEPTLVHPFK
jgi:hypothetical protein